MIMLLSKYFTLQELKRTSQRDSAGLIYDNHPPDDVLIMLQRLVAELDKIRAFIDLPITINSGYRSELVNRAVGGAPNSKHKQGLAADIECYKMSNNLKFLTAILNTPALNFDKVILECYRPGIADSGWIHFQIAPPSNVSRRLVYSYSNASEGFVLLSSNQIKIVREGGVI